MTSMLPGGGKLDTRFGMNPNGEILVQVRQDSDEGAEGLVRIDKNNKATWISPPQEKVRGSSLSFAPYEEAGPREKELRSAWKDYAEADLQIAAQHDGGFVMLDPKRGLYRIGAISEKIWKLAETELDDLLIGCDSEGRIYLRRSEAILVFSPSALPVPPTDLREHFELVAGMPSGDAPVFPDQKDLGTPLAATIDSGGNLLALGVGKVRGEYIEILERGSVAKVLRNGKKRSTRGMRFARDLDNAISAVSYTHLTLPTIYSV